jgi:hypothetical protein
VSGLLREMGVALGAAVIATGGIALFVYWLASALSGRRHALHHLGRLACEIAGVAQSIDSDLALWPAHAAVVFRLQCQQHRHRASEALDAQELDRLSLQEMEAWLARLHEDHRHMVDLRSALDAELAGLERLRSSRLLPPGRAARSSWPGSGYQQSGLT